jgi:hypothetical protein
LADALAKAGIEIWIDREEIDPLDDFPARIRNGLARSHALLAWYSPEYAQSSYCQKELTAAWICTQRLTRDVLSRILVLDPDEGVGKCGVLDVREHGRQSKASKESIWPRCHRPIGNCYGVARDFGHAA